jgi:predicted acyltransferase
VYEHIYAPLASPVNASLLYALTYVAILYGVSWFMYRMNGLFACRKHVK